MKPTAKQSTAGFTLIEMIIVVVIISILAGIAAPSWLAFLNKQRLATAQAEAVSAIREAQANAKKQKSIWEVCFQDDGTKVRWFVHPINLSTSNCTTNPGAWNDMLGADANNISIDSASTMNQSGNYYSMQFQYNGWVNGQLNGQPKIIFKTRGQESGSKRCVYVATILGALRTANDGDCSSN